MMPDTEAGTAAPETTRTGCYVYGILPDDVEVMPGTRGLHEREVRLVRHGEIAALVSEIDLDRPIGRPEELAAHQRVLDGAAIEAPVLPLRFGAVLSDTGAVEDELLAGNHDEFREALRQFEGRAEYVVKGRYDERAVLREILAEDPEAARLREETRAGPEAETHDLRVMLGEIIGAAIEAKRDVDTQEVIEALAPHTVASADRPPTHSEDAVHLALLVENTERAEIEKAIEAVGRRWQGRVALRLLGPMAPYDFVVAEGG